MMKVVFPSIRVERSAGHAETDASPLGLASQVSRVEMCTDVLQ